MRVIGSRRTDLEARFPKAKFIFSPSGITRITAIAGTLFFDRFSVIVARVTCSSIPGTRLSRAASRLNNGSHLAFLPLNKDERAFSKCFA
ncbi:MAG TPA: hypothetical protein DCS07_15055 [Bdellovibrionales bacterium]|nr:MAG: hypothetical protein A2Z97_10165 [Bdellovibrionales bacterium GWB1_52_6]OFZ05282.1 MAG: hypothetical protein A2X97_10875 [Bdellovibrionales bacterium GWA1_52_35]OFZ42168.1 MAG: hypothetical protein A2070_07555 [Bdellovibrionales bacterium GWC1_52_8]HAR43929.1 hypothetical protein [Bdellovibrionales bacterium]HCM38580.1 hypothetical protein [Bdellovibrionales bacterium]